MEFYSSVLTRAGAELIARAQLGTSEIAFTRVATGDGTYPELDKGALQDLLEEKTGLINERCSFGIADKEQINRATLKLSWVMDNSRDINGKPIEQGYFTTEVGIYAQDLKDPGAPEVLYGLAVALPGKADWIPAYNGLLPAMTIFDLYVEVANAAEVKIVASNSTYALAEDVWELRSKFENLEASQLIRSNVTIPWESWKQINGGWEARCEKEWIGTDMVPFFSVLPESAETAFTADLNLTANCEHGALVLQSVLRPTGDIKAQLMCVRAAQTESRIRYGELGVPRSAWTADLRGVHARIPAEWISGDMVPDVRIPNVYASATADCYMEAATEDGALLLSADRAPTQDIAVCVLCLRPSNAMFWADPVAAMMPATRETMGAVRIGTGIDLAADGTISVDHGSEGAAVATPEQVRDLIDSVYNDAD